MVPPVPVIDYLLVFQGNTSKQSGAQFPAKTHLATMECSWKYKISIFNVVLVVPIECYSWGWQSAVESPLFSGSQKLFFIFGKSKAIFIFSKSKAIFIFSKSKAMFFLASVSQVPPSYFQCLSRGSKPSNILEYSLFVNIAIIILDDVIEAYNLSQFCQF